MMEEVSQQSVVSCPPLWPTGGDKSTLRTMRYTGDTPWGRKMPTGYGQPAGRNRLNMGSFRSASGSNL